MGDIEAYDLSRFQRLIAVEGGRVTGTFRALGFPDEPDRGVNITPVDVVVWHGETHDSGRVLHSDELAVARVLPGQPVENPVRGGAWHDVEDAREDWDAAIHAVAAKFWRAVTDGADS